MLIVLSPAKSLNEDCTPVAGISLSTPRFWNDASKLASALDALGQEKLGTLMGISDTLARLNAERYASFPKTISSKNGKPAGYYFSGDVYQGMDFASFSAQQAEAAQGQIRILSGLYGLLRPLDAIYPYRLEMGTKWGINNAKNLYAYWGSRISEALNEDAHALGTDTLINLASNEYAKAIDKKALKLHHITIDFKERKGNQLKTIGLFAKRARGMMARYVITEKIEAPEGLKDFNMDGYGFDSALSDAKKFVFIRG
jgi:cytoplasmic iron level regulating protein YaaA (DUF328/UPF0246 family)